MITRPSVFTSILITAACGPGRPPSDDTDGRSSTSGETASTQAPPTSSSDTTGDGTTGDDMTGTGGSSGDGSSGEPPCCAPLGEPTSTVAGMTTFGPLSFPWAWYGVRRGECGGMFNAFLYTDPPPPEIGNANVGTYLLVTVYAEEWLDGFQGTGPASYHLFDELETDLTSGEITITALEQNPGPQTCEPGVPLLSDARFTFTVSLHKAGMNIDGEVSAVYCPSCDVHCP